MKVIAVFNIFLVLHACEAFSADQIISPKLLTSVSSNATFPKHVSVSFKHRQDFILYLQKKDDSILHEPSLLQTNCMYYGTVNNESLSSCKISLCNGLHGTIELNQEIYYIRPKTFHENESVNLSLINNEHVLIEEKIDAVNISMSNDTFVIDLSQKQNNLTHTLSRTKRGAKHSSNDAMKKIKFIELYLVNDHSVYKHFKKNISFIEERNKLIANLIDERFKQLRLRVVLVGTEIWNEKDMIQVSGNSHSTLMNFMKYRKNHINKKVRNDNAQFMTKVVLDNGKTAGKAPIATICNYDYSAGIGHDSHLNPIHIANILAHEIGHNLGMSHDKMLRKENECICNDHGTGKCLMNSHLDSKVKSFSSCSKESFENIIAKGHGRCLFDFPSHRKKPAICGNGIIEGNEECDCGHPDVCAKYGYCCHPETCQLYRNATCASGECCSNCNFKRESTVCRKNEGECDLQEYCTGKSGECPKDVFYQNAISCENGQGYCTEGVCMTHEHQCTDWFGISSVSASAHCYKEFNVYGFSGGHCGKVSEKYLKCESADTYCGKLQCALNFPDETQVEDSQTKILKNTMKWKNIDKTVECVTVSFKDYNSNGNLSLAKDGTRCGQDKICFRKKCIPTIAYRQQTLHKHCPKNCSGNGICNNKNHCHCFEGWAPPMCEHKGVGGSIDSGPLTFILEPSSDDGSKRNYIILTVVVVTLTIVVMVFSRKISRLIMNKLTNKMADGKHKPNSEELKDLLEK